MVPGSILEGVEIMPDMPAGLLNCPENWLGADFADNEDWIDAMPPEVVSDIDAALAEAKDRGLRPTGFGKDDFPLPAFADFARHIQNEMEEGRGFVLVRGLPMERYTKEDAAIVFWGLACHLGQIVSQNRYGDMIGHVRDLGRDMRNPSARFYETRLSQDVHNDLSDWISLMCLRQAKSEGVSTLASAAAIHDIMMAERPDLVRVLYEPLTIDRRNEPGWPEEESELYYRLPVFTYFKGRLTSRLLPKTYYETAERHPGVEKLTKDQDEALDLLLDVAHRPGISHNFLMRPGDIQFANNYSVLHSRSTYDDWDEPDRKRHLLRIWICPPNSRELPPTFKSRYRSVAPGTARGWIPKSTERELEPAE